MPRLIAEIEESIARGSRERQAVSLSRVTDLFLRDAAVLTDEQVELFDVVITRLAAAIETSARAELSNRLSLAEKAPPAILHALAHDEILVARPILTRSPRLTNDMLVAVARAKGRDHMLAISERPTLAELVTDVLVARGDRAVSHAVAGNPGARFSGHGLTTLLDRSRADEALQMLLGQRHDLPEPQLRRLLTIAKETARRRLFAGLPDRTPEALDAAVDAGATRVEAAVLQGGRDFGPALAAVQALAAARPLTEADCASFAATGRVEETVCTIAVMTGLSLVAAERAIVAANELLLVIAKSQDWQWPTVRALVALRHPEDVAPQRLKRTAEAYEQLPAATARRAVQFLKVREASQRRATVTAARRQIRVVWG